MCSCAPPNTGDIYAACASVPFAPPVVDDSTLLNIAAGAGARSSDFTMCLAMAFLKTRRMIYWRVTPGDCGTKNIDVSGLTATEANLESLGGGIGAKLLAVPDPTMVTKAAGAILTGLSSIFGVFTQAHIQAVQTEETTLCQVSIKYNGTMQEIENAVAAGRLSPDNANAFMDELQQQLDPVLTSIAKKCCGQGSCDAACGFRIALRALQTFNKKYVFPALAPVISFLGPVTSLFTPAVQASAGAPGTSNNPAPPMNSGVPTMMPTSVSLPGGENGLIWVGGGLLVAKVVGAI